MCHIPLRVAIPACLPYHSRVSDIKFEEMNPVGDAVEVINSVRSRNIYGSISCGMDV